MPTFTYPGIQVSTAGLATSTKQDTIIAELQDIDANTADVSTETTLSALNAKVTAVDTGSVAVASSALPSGAATEASLAIVAGDTTSLDAKLPAQGAALTAASVPVNIASDQTVPVSAASLPLPTGAATESTLSTLNGKVTACDTGSVTVVSSALPSGAATEASLATVAGDTTSLDTKVPAQGAAVTASSIPVNIASDQTVPVSAASLPLPSGAATEASLATVAGDTTSLDAKVPAQGAAVTAASVPVNIASDQTVPVSAASLPLPSGAATESTLSTLNGKVTACNTGAVVISSSALPSGAATAANQASILAELQRIETKTPVDFLDTGLLDASSTNIATAGTTVVASLAANCSELEIVEDIGEFMALTDGSDVILAYLPLGGGRVKVSISSSTALKLKSLTGSAITTGEIAINFLD